MVDFPIFIFPDLSFATHSYLLIRISLQTNGINLSYFNLRFVDKQNSYERSTTSDCKDIGGRKSEFVAKTQFLSLKETNPRFSTLPFKSYENKWKICIFF